MTKKNRIVATVLAAIAVVVMLSSSLFIIEHADHDCIGDDCAVCEQINICAQTLKNLSIAVLATTIAYALGFSLHTAFGRIVSAFISYTPVLLKVKLSN